MNDLNKAVPYHGEKYIRKGSLVITLDHVEDGIYRVMPQVLFKPLGMMIQGATQDSWITSVKVGCQEQFQGRLAAAFFSLGLSYEAINQLIENGELPVLPSRFEIMNHACEVGNAITVKTEGPYTSIAMWGIFAQ